MELLYFIGGILSVGVTYGIILLRTVKSSHTEILTRTQSLSNIYSIRFDDVAQAIDDLDVQLRDIQTNMEKDQYESVSGINKKLEEVSKLTNVINVRLGETNKVFNKNVSDAFTEIQQLKNGLKALGQDPNFLNRYS